jgi:RimJ/RimL family protein N-acetyltransferase
MIETGRLLLRKMTAEDLDELVAIHAEPEVMRFMGVFDHSKASEWLVQNHAEWSERGHGRLAIVDRATGRLLGRTGLKYWPQFRETEVGWVLRPDGWGHGFATEAARGCVNWGFQNFDLPYLTAMIRPDNRRSVRVAERLGMRPLRDDLLLEERVIVYAINREAWGRQKGRPSPLKGIALRKD